MLALILVSVTTMIAESSEQTKQVALASEVLTKIKAGEPADFDDHIIVGDLNLNAMKIEMPVHFNRAIFRDSVVFTQTTFDNVADFSGSEFNRNADFRGSKFDSDAYFRSTKFNNDASFGDSYFNNSADFMYSKFNNEANFANSDFSGKADFRTSIFNSYANFRRSEFIEIADFRSSSFKSDADFWDSSFSGKANFEKSSFSGKANFVNSYFVDKARFMNSEFKSDADFTDSKFNNDVDFTDSSFSFYFMVTWDNLKDHLIYSDNVYQVLIRTFKSNSLFYEANDCYYIYRDNNKRNIIDYLAKYTCGFGVKWDYTIGFAILVWMLFGLLYCMGDHFPKESFAFSAVALFSLPRESFPYGDEKYNSVLGNNISWNILFLQTLKCPFRFLFSFERLIGWGLLILFINTLSRVMMHY
jgi:hypothetical protein